MNSSDDEPVPLKEGKGGYKTEGGGYKNSEGGYMKQFGPADARKAHKDRPDMWRRRFFTRPGEKVSTVPSHAIAPCCPEVTLALTPRFAVLARRTGAPAGTRIRGDGGPLCQPTLPPALNGIGPDGLPRLRKEAPDFENPPLALLDSSLLSQQRDNKSQGTWVPKDVVEKVEADPWVLHSKDKANTLRVIAKHYPSIPEEDAKELYTLWYALFLSPTSGAPRHHQTYTTRLYVMNKYTDFKMDAPLDEDREAIRRAHQKANEILKSWKQPREKGEKESIGSEAQQQDAFEPKEEETAEPKEQEAVETTEQEVAEPKEHEAVETKELDPAKTKEQEQ